MFNYSVFTDRYAKHLCSDTYGFTPNMRFTFKCLITKRPEVTVSTILIGSICIISYLLRTYEIVYYRAVHQLDFEQYLSAIWVVVITMGTVGFGDIVPVSPFGRFIIMFTQFWGAFVITLVLVAFSNFFNLNRNQKKAMHHLYLTRMAAATITSAMKLYYTKKNSNLSENKLLKMKDALNENLQEFKSERLELQNLSQLKKNDTKQTLSFIQSEVSDLKEIDYELRATLERQNLIIQGIADSLKIVIEQQSHLRNQIYQIKERQVSAQSPVDTTSQKSETQSQTKRRKLKKLYSKTSSLQIMKDSKYEPNYVSSADERLPIQQAKDTIIHLKEIPEPPSFELQVSDTSPLNFQIAKSPDNTTRAKPLRNKLDSSNIIEEEKILLPIFQLNPTPTIVKPLTNAISKHIQERQSKKSVARQQQPEMLPYIGGAIQQSKKEPTTLAPVSTMQLYSINAEQPQGQNKKNNNKANDVPSGQIRFKFH